MFPFSHFRRVLQERRLRRECLDEILTKVANEGITLYECVITTSKPGIEVIGEDKNPRIRLEELKRSKTSYKIEVEVFDLDERIKNSHETLRFCKEPEGYYYIGKTAKKDYREQMAEHKSELEKLWRNDPELVNHTEEILERLRDTYSQRYSEWKNTSMSEWERRNNENGGSCPCCGGYGYLYTMDIATAGSNCSACNGNGTVSADELRVINEPKFQPDSSDIALSILLEDQRIARVLEERKRDNPKLYEPVSYTRVYIRFLVN